MGRPLSIIVDHLVGSRRGQRQAFDPQTRVRFGRHPDNDVSFDAHRDLDASSRHAELHRTDGGDGFVLRDIGSSNGTLIDGKPVPEIAIAVGESVVVEFGAGGPRLRIYAGDPDHVPPLPELANDHEPIALGARLVVATLIAAVVGAALIAWAALT